MKSRLAACSEPAPLRGNRREPHLPPQPATQIRIFVSISGFQRLDTWKAGGGGLNLACLDEARVLRGIRSLCDKYEILMICDEAVCRPRDMEFWFGEVKCDQPNLCVVAPTTAA